MVCLLATKSLKESGMNLYNDNDSFAVDQLRWLVRSGKIKPGDVTDCSIAGIQESDLRDYSQVHLFAGIGGWPLAFEMAGIADVDSVWSGSCPCQPFSTAGKGKGINDERHLWPEMRRLVELRKPSIVFGEQVAAKAGREWLSVVRTEMEEMGYAFGAADLCAASIGNPQIRKRLFWGAARIGGEGRERLVERKNPCITRPWRWRGEEDLQKVSSAPFERGNLWPRPIVRKMDDGVPRRVAQCRAYGNAIVPQLAAEFIVAFLDSVAALQGN